MEENIKRSFQLFYKKMYNSFYFITRKKNLEKNKVIFAISRGNKLEGNLKYIYEEIKNDYPELKIHFVVAENKMNLKLLRELLLIKDAKYIILDDYYLPVYLLNLKKEVKIIQVWHAAGALKKFGYSTIGTVFGPSKKYLDIVPIHSNYTHVYVSAEHIKQYYAEAFNMEENKIHTYGIPRSEMFLSNQEENKQHIYQQLEIKAEDKVIILWAPTYRAERGYAESELDMIALITYVMRNITEDIIILYKSHPYSKLKLNELVKFPNFIICDKNNVNELMLVSDALITDYSSVIFDYSLLKRPIAHYVPDLEEYTKNRGFYEPIQIVSDGVIIYEVEKLIGWINERKKNEYYETDKMIKYNFSNLKNPTQKIVNHFINEE